MNDLLALAEENGMETITTVWYGSEYKIPVWARYIYHDVYGWITVFEHMPIKQHGRFARDQTINSRTMIISRTGTLNEPFMQAIIN
jgi:hypothetical protein